MSKKEQTTKKAAAGAPPPSTTINMSLAIIQESPTNPRRTFGEEDLAELTESIRALGVIQPIVVRPATDSTYELVCGARRYRAALQAGLEEVPAVIRHLSDDQAFEMSVTENLQRKDVHPLDEALAFCGMRDRGYSTSDTAGRLGKSESYILQRMKLAEMTPALAEAFYANKVLFTHARKIARLRTEDQQAVFERFYSEWKSDDFNPNVNSLDNFIKNVQRHLKDAAFDINDANLLPAAGSCATCPKNTACATLLFPEYGADDARCTDTACWSAKVSQHISALLDQAANGEFLLARPNYNSMSDAMDALVKERGLKVFRIGWNEELEMLTEPTPPEAVDPSDYEFGDGTYYDTKEEAKEALKEAKDDYKREFKEYQDELAEFNALVASGTMLKAINVADGEGLGKILHVKMNERNTAAASREVLAATNPDAAIRDEIYGIQTREKRAKELDGEKVHRALVEVHIKEPRVKGEELAEIGKHEKVALCAYIYDRSDYQGRTAMKTFIWGNEEGDIHNQQRGDLDLLEAIEKLGEHVGSIDLVLATLTRMAITSTYQNNLPTYEGGKILRRLMSDNLTLLAISEVEDDQAEKAAKRAKRVAQRISELEAKLTPPAEAKAPEKAPKKAKAEKVVKDAKDTVVQELITGNEEPAAEADDTITAEKVLKTKKVDKSGGKTLSDLLVDEDPAPKKEKPAAKPKKVATEKAAADPARVKRKYTRKGAEA